MSSSFALLGATGLVGSNILSYLLESPTPVTVSTLTRRDLGESTTEAATKGKHSLIAKVEKDNDKWPAEFGQLCKEHGTTVALSGLATTRAAAGGFDKQYALEHGTNVAAAKAAKEAGVKTYVLISAAGADKNSSMGYPKMKGEIEADIEALGFEKYIIVRPGLLLGTRTESRFGEAVAQSAARLIGRFSTALTDPWAQTAETVARASVRAALDDSIQDTKILYQKDIVELGKKEGW